MKMKMKMKKPFLYSTVLLFALVILSCTKKETFVHSNDEISYPCECCEIGDSIPGQYTGQLRIYDNSNWTLANPVPGTITLDTTITIDIERTFTNSDFISDSLLCQYEIPYFFSNQVIVSSEGQIAEPNDYDYQKFRLNATEDTFQLHLRNVYFPFYPGPSLVSYEFIGNKQ